MIDLDVDQRPDSANGGGWSSPGQLLRKLSSNNSGTPPPITDQARGETGSGNVPGGQENQQNATLATMDPLSQVREVSCQLTIYPALIS